MSYRQYLKEFEETSFSDPTVSTDDYMYSNAKAMEIYGQGKRFTIEDNLMFYEVVKIVKDVIDRHYYQNQTQLYIQIKDKELVFSFLIDKTENRYTFFIETLYMFVTTQIYRQFGNYFEISREDGVTEDNKVVLKIFVKKTEEQTNERD